MAFNIGYNSFGNFCEREIIMEIYRGNSEAGFIIFPDMASSSLTNIYIMNKKTKKHWEDYEVQIDGGSWTTVYELLKSQREQDIKAFEEMIGEDETPEEYIAKHLNLKEITLAANALQFQAKNKLKAELRTKLNQYKKEVIK